MSQHTKNVGYYIFLTRLLLLLVHLDYICVCVCCYYFFVFVLSLTYIYRRRTLRILTDWSLHPIAIVPFIEMVMWSSRNTRRLLKKCFSYKNTDTHTHTTTKNDSLICCCCFVSFFSLFKCVFILYFQLDAELYRVRIGFCFFIRL